MSSTTATPRIGELFGSAITLLDLETTGADPSRDRITEIGLIELEAHQPVDAPGATWSSLVDPGQPIPPFITRLTGIDDAMVATAPAFAALAGPLAERLAGRLLIAHNVRFDHAFLRAEFARVGVAFAAAALCSARLSRRLYPQEHRHNLDAVMQRHGLRCSARHRALGDARVLGDFIAAATADRGVGAVQAAAAALARPAEAARVAADFALDLPEGAGCALLLDAQGRALQAVAGARLRAEFMRQFSRPGPRARALLAAIARIEYEPSAGALGAALARLRAESRLPAGERAAGTAPRASWRLAWTAGETPAFGVCEVSERAVPPDAWFGDFADEPTARRVLSTIARAHRLCPPLLGLAPLPPARCASAREGRCAGACPREAAPGPADLHLERALAALRRLPGPPALPTGPHAWREHAADGRSEIHLFDGARYLGSAHEETALAGLRAVPRGTPASDRRAARLLEAALQTDGSLQRLRLTAAGDRHGADPAPDAADATGPR